MRLPPECGALSGEIVLLHCALYGLKQSSRTWNAHLVTTLQSLGFKQCPADPCILPLREGDTVTIMLTVRVDDILAVVSESDCHALRDELYHVFPTKYLGSPSWYTGCAYVRDWEAGTLVVQQTAYIDQVCDRFGVSTPGSLPASSTVELMPHQVAEPRGDERFRELIGPLLWIANQTRPDLGNTVRALARHSHIPSKTHWKVGLQALAYL
ncbi:unnamed protein product, partial [Discosporangium mesarthrocarpum]